MKKIYRLMLKSYSS